MGKHGSRSKTPGPRSSTAPPERQHRSSRRPTTTLDTLGEDEDYDAFDTGYPSGGSSSRPFETLDELYNHVVSTGPAEGESSSGSHKHRKKRSGHKSSSQPSRYSATPAPQSSSRRSVPPRPPTAAPSYSGGPSYPPGSSYSSYSGASSYGGASSYSGAPSYTSGPSYYSETVDRAEAVAMQNTHLYNGDGSLNPMLAPFVATGAEGEEQAPEGFWQWNSLIQRYTHEDEQTNTVMLCPKPDAFP